MRRLIVDLGPEGGDEGGRVVAVGTPEQVAEVGESHTGRYLRAMLEKAERPRAQKRAKAKTGKGGSKRVRAAE